MKLHLNLSLRRALLAAMAAVATFATSVTAGVMHDDVSIITYTDYAQNLGRYVQGTKVNSLLSYIRSEEGGITINYNDGTKYVISNEQGIVDSSGVHDNGALTAISPNFLATVNHNGSNNASFGERVVGNEHAINYSAIDIRYSNIFRLAPLQADGVTQYDYALERQSKIATDANWISVTTVDDLSTLQGEYIYHIGAGRKYMWDSTTNQAIELAEPYTYISGGINSVGSVQIHSGSTNLSIHQNFSYPSGVGADEVNPLPNQLRDGDSGSPIFVYNASTGQYEYLAAQQSYNTASTYAQARGDVTWTQQVLESYNVRVNMQAHDEVHLYAASTQGEYYVDKFGNLAITYTGKVTDSQGQLLAEYNGVQSGLNTWADLSDLKDTQNWYAYNSEKYLQRSDTELFHTQNLVFSGNGGEKDLVLQESLDLGVGYAEFNNGKFTIRSQEDARFMFNHAGYVINAGAEVHLQLVNPENYMTEWRKSGAGDLYIEGTGDTNALLNLGGSGTTYLQQKDGYAAYNVLVNTGASVVIQDVNQIKRDFTFGSGGGTLDMNGITMEWYETTDGDNRFTINALTEQALIANTGSKGVTLTFKEAGNRTYLGSFADSANGSLRIDYQGGGTWQLHSIHTDLTKRPDSGLTVSNGRVILVGTNTVHAKGSIDGRQSARLDRVNDWHYADAAMNVQVRNNAIFELGSHARLTGDISVENGGLFVMRESVQHSMEYVEGGLYLEDTAKYAAYHGLKGNVSLAAGATMAVQFNKGTTADTCYSGSISGAGALIVDSGSDGGRFILTGDNTAHTGSKSVLGGGLIFANENAIGDTSENKWFVGSSAYITSELFVEGYDTLAHVDSMSSGVLALSSDYDAAIDMSGHSNLVLGALEGTVVQYGINGTRIDYDANGNPVEIKAGALAAVNGGWRFGGAGGELQVNFQLTGEGNLYLGADSTSRGIVTLANENNDFTGNIIFNGHGITLNASEKALGSANIALGYGNAYIPDSAEMLNRVSTGSEGVLLVDKIASSDLDLSSHTELVIGASQDTEYTGNISVGSAVPHYRFSAINGAILGISRTIEANSNILVDGQGFSEGKVRLALSNEHSGNIVVRGNSDSLKGGDVSLQLNSDVNTTGTISLQKGGTLDINGRNWTISGQLQTVDGSAIADSKNSGTVEFAAASGEYSISADVAVGTFKKTGDATLTLTGDVNITTFNCLGGSVVFSAQDGPEVATYNVKSVVGGGSGGFEVESNAVLNVGSMSNTNTWHVGMYKIDGEMNVSGDVALRYGSGDSISGSGVLNIDRNLGLQNWGSTNVAVAEMNIGGDLNLNSYGMTHAVNLNGGCINLAGKLTMSEYLGTTRLNIDGAELRLNGTSSLSVGEINLKSGQLTQVGGSTSIANKFTMSGGVLNVAGGSVNVSSAVTVTAGSINVTGGVLALSGDGASMLQGAATTTVSGAGVLDLSAISFSEGGIELGTGSLKFDGGGIAFGALEAGQTYAIFSGGSLQGWDKDNLSAEHIFINGQSLLEYGRINYTLGQGGSFSYTVEDSWDLVWNGGETDTWNDVSSNEVWQTTRPNEMMGTEDTFNTRFTNNDNVLFNSNANLELEGNIIVNNMSVADNVSLVTKGSLSVAGDLTVGNGISWAFSGDTSLSFTEGELKAANSIVVGDGATLIMTDKTTTQNKRSTAFDNVSGTGNVVLNLGMDNGVGFDLSGISGDITVATGRLQVNQSAFNDDSTIYLTTSDSQLVFNGNGTVLNNDVVLGADTTVHANSSCSGTIAGVISGNAGFTKAGAGTLTFAAQNTYTGTTSISGGKLILANGGDYTLLNSVSGGTLEVANGTTLVNNGKEITSSLVLAAGSAAEMNGSCVLKGAITVNNGAVLTFIGNGSDTLDWNTGNPITVDGGTIDFGNTRQSIGSWAITLKNGALLTGTGENANGSDFNVALDFYRDATINVTSGENTIAATSRLRDSNERTLTYNVSANAALNVTGRIHAGSATATVGNVVKNGAGSATISSQVMLGKIKANAGDITVAYTGEGGNTVKAVELSNGAELRVAEGAALNISNSSVEISGRSATASMSTTASSATTYSVSSTDIELTDAHVTYTGGDATISNKLTNSSIENAGSGTLTVDNAGNTLSGVFATGGSMKLFSDAELDLEELRIASSFSVSAYCQLSEQAQQTEQEARINVSGTATFGNDVTLNADLVMKTGSSLNMAGAVQMGSDVRLETGLTLTGSLYDNVKSMQAGERVTLFTGVDTLYLGSSPDAATSITLSDGVQAKDYFTNLSDNYFLIYDTTLGEGLGEISIGMVVPEPTTATLSLVALAALAMRRRRK